MQHQADQSIESRIAASLNPEPPAETQQQAPVEPQNEAPQEIPEQNHLLDVSETPLEAPESPVEETSPEPDGEDTPEENVAESASEEASEEIEEYSIEDLNSLAEYLEIDPADLYNIAVPISEDGVRVDVTLGDLKDGATTSRKAKKLEAEAQALREEAAQEQQRLHQQFDQNMQAVQGYLEKAHQALNQDYQSVDWNKLQQEDPGRAAWLNQQYQQRNQELQQAWVQANQEYEQNMAELQKTSEEHLGQHLQQEERFLLDKVPEWKDAKVREAETSKLKDFLLDTGYTPEQIAKAYDHKILVLARKAMLYDQTMKKAKVATKKVAKLGSKNLKSGARQSKAQLNKERVDSLRSQARKTGKVDDAAAAISARLNPR